MTFFAPCWSIKSPEMLYIDLYLLLGFFLGGGGRGGRVEGERYWGGLGEGRIYKLIKNLEVGIKVLTVVLVCTSLVIALLNWNSWMNSPSLFQWWLFSPLKKL